MIKEPSPAVARVLRAFQGERYKWRTIEGISKEVGLPAKEVEKILRENPDLFREGGTSLAGIPLYALRNSAPKKDYSAYVR